MDDFDALVAHWRRTVDQAAFELAAVTDADARRRPAPGKWSIKEIVGHLVDSAANNHRRFVEAQLHDDLIVHGYAQDAWVHVQRYQESPWPDLVALWAAYNFHLAGVIRGTPAEALERPRPRHNLGDVAWQPVPQDAPATLGWLVRDYVGHLEHHLAQVRALMPPAGLE